MPIRLTHRRALPAAAVLAALTLSAAGLAALAGPALAADTPRRRRRRPVWVVRRRGRLA